ncbi:uncharacterized protein TNCV_2562651 [Trichonephila clavipes]|uniref:Uncharacterized protein n=1 Tax=Trichonephila clavipes TaxID=2585209 RepID=A0A8X6R6V0_TRICX|nr:uncharacterized protein TNCV_2562651 [Trichonephila clavipes]
MGNTHMSYFWQDNNRGNFFLVPEGTYNSQECQIAIEESVQVYRGGCGSPEVKVSDHGRHVMNSSQVPLKTRRVGERYTLNLSRALTSSHWCGVVVRRGGASSGIVLVT